FELDTSDLSTQGPEGRVQQDRIRTVAEEAVNRDLESAAEILNSANVTHLLDGWRKNFDESITSVVEFARQQNSLALEQLKFRVSESSEDLTDRILASGHIRFERRDTNHLTELWRTAQSYLLIVHDGFTIDELNEIWASTEETKVSAVHLIL